MNNIVSIYNFKGGVGKTTNTHELAWSLCRAGQNVLVLDFDPQCSVSSLFLMHEMRIQNGQGISTTLDDENGVTEDWDTFLARTHHPTISQYLQNDIPATRVCRFVRGDQFSEINLVVGDEMISAFESALYVSNSMIPQPLMQSFRQIITPYEMLVRLSVRHQPDVIILDLNPTWGALNKNLLGISQYWICPCAIDCFTLSAIRTLTRRIQAEILQLNAGDVSNQRYLLQESFGRAGLVVNHSSIRFLGSIVNKFRVQSWPTGNSSEGIERVIANLQDACQLIPFTVPAPFSLRLSNLEQVSVVSHRTGIPPNFVTSKLCSSSSYPQQNVAPRVQVWNDQIKLAVDLLCQLLTLNQINTPYVLHLSGVNTRVKRAILESVV